MKSIILICAICLQLGWSYGAKRDSKGIGAFAYGDTNGHRSRSRRFSFLPPLPPLPPLRPFRRFSLIPDRSPFSDFPGFSGFPAFPTPPPFPSLPGFDMPTPMPNFGANSAFAAAALAPGFRQQIAAISPANPNNPNINMVSRFSDTAKPGGNFYSVSSSSFASQSNVNGQQETQRGAETVVNDNGKVTKYKLQS